MVRWCPSLASQPSMCVHHEEYIRIFQPIIGSMCSSGAHYEPENLACPHRPGCYFVAGRCMSTDAHFDGQTNSAWIPSEFHRGRAVNDGKEEDFNLPNCITMFNMMNSYKMLEEGMLTQYFRARSSVWGWRAIRTTAWAACTSTSSEMRDSRRATSSTRGR